MAPPKAGKTTLLKRMAHAVEVNDPDVHVIVLLIDERPEEITDFRRSVARGEVIASSADLSAENHIAVAEIVAERARRLIECGKHVIIFLDSITRMARAYNHMQKGGGKILSGGIDARTMEKPRRFFGGARNAEGGGSLTIVATALVDTGSRMDEIIFQEFKGTGNTEILLDRDLFNRRIFPCINIPQSGTRKEEKLYDPGGPAQDRQAPPGARGRRQDPGDGARARTALEVQDESRLPEELSRPSLRYRRCASLRDLRLRAHRRTARPWARPLA